MNPHTNIKALAQRGLLYLYVSSLLLGQDHLVYESMIGGYVHVFGVGCQLEGDGVLPGCQRQSDGVG